MVKARRVRRHLGQVAGPRAERFGAGWRLTVWTVTGQDLVKHSMTVSEDGAVDDRAETVARDMPVPASR